MSAEDLDVEDPCRLGEYVGEDLLERVKTDPETTAYETETGFRFSKTADVGILQTHERALMRRTLANPFATVLEVTVVDGERARPTVGHAEYRGRPIVGVRAAVPLSVPRLLTSTPRTHTQHADLATIRALDDEWRRELVERFPTHVGRVPQEVRDR
jgi:hypothetical protein